MTTSAPPPPASVSRTRNAISALLFVAAAALLAGAIYLYIQDRRGGDQPPPPPSIPGRAELKNVHDVLVAEGFEVAYGRESARIDGLSLPGQQLVVDGNDLYVFIFSDPGARQQDMRGVSQDDLALVSAFGEVIAERDVWLAQGSNVATVLVGGDAEMAARIESAVQSLP